MEGVLEAVVIVFMLFLCMLCLFAVLVIARDIVSDMKEKHRKATADKEKSVIDYEYLEEKLGETISEKLDAKFAEAEAQASLEAAKLAAEAAAIEAAKLAAEAEAVKALSVSEAQEDFVSSAPAVEVVDIKAEDDSTLKADDEASRELAEALVPQLVLVEDDSDEDENEVSFSKTHKLTMEEKYAALSSEFKAYFDEIKKFALSKEGAKELKKTSSYDYKIGSRYLVRMSIKKGDIICELLFVDRDFKNYASASNIKMKPSSTSVKITDAASVGIAKDGIDLVLAQIIEEREYKKALAREKRREKRKEQQTQEDAPKGELINV